MPGKVLKMDFSGLSSSYWITEFSHLLPSQTHIFTTQYAYVWFTVTFKIVEGDLSKNQTWDVLLWSQNTEQDYTG